MFFYAGYLRSAMIYTVVDFFFFKHVFTRNVGHVEFPSETENKTYVCIIWLVDVGGCKHFLFSISYMGCHPSQLTHSYFSRWLLHHQPVILLEITTVRSCWLWRPSVVQAHLRSVHHTRPIIAAAAGT